MFKTLMAIGGLGLATLGHANFNASRYGDLKVVGNKIMTISNNCPVFLKGTNIPSMEWQNQGEGPAGTTNGVLDTAKNAVNNWNANVIRVPVYGKRSIGVGVLCLVNMHITFTLFADFTIRHSGQCRIQ